MDVCYFQLYGCLFKVKNNAESSLEERISSYLINLHKIQKLYIKDLGPVSSLSDNVLQVLARDICVTFTLYVSETFIY